MTDTEIEPVSEVEPEPEIEPEVQPEPEVESEVGPEPGVESEVEPGARAAERVLTEPEPEWDLAFKELGSAWELHVYTMAIIFMIIAILSLISMSYYLKDRHALKQGTLTFTLQCLLLYFTLLRALVMFINPYQTVGNINNEVFSLMWSFALPGLTASFSVLLLVFLDTTKMTLGPPVFQRISVLLIFTACHFVIVVSSDILCTVNSNICKPMQLFCQIIFICYGAALSLGYGYTAICLHKKCVTGVLSEAETCKIIRLVRIAGFASCIALSIAMTHLYAACSHFGIYSDVVYVNAWEWWILQSILRLEEIGSSILIIVIAFRCPLSENSKLKFWKANSLQVNVHPVPGTDVATYAKSHL